MNYKKILITGANSFVGANLTKKLISEGFEVHALMRKTSNKWRLKGISNLKKYEVDLRSRKKLFDIVNQINPEVIFHLATQGIYGGIHSNNKLLIETNFLGTINLIDACKSIDYSCFVNTGSSSEYGLKNKPMKEDDICSPINMYGLTKNASTQYGQLIAKKENKPIISLRLFSPFGPLDDERRLISNATIKALQNQEIKLANPKIARDYIFIEDVIDLYLKSIEKSGEFKGEVFNVGSGIQTKIYDVVENIMQITKSKSEIQWGNYKSRDYDSENWVADMEKTKKYFNWKPKYNLNQGLEKTIDWFKLNLDKYQIK